MKRTLDSWILIWQTGQTTSTLALWLVIGIETTLSPLNWRCGRWTAREKDASWAPLPRTGQHQKEVRDTQRTRIYHGSKLHSPGGIVRPIVDIGEQKAASSHITFILDINSQRRRNIAWSFGCQAHNLSCRDRLNSANFTINNDIDVSDCCWEACTGESNWLSSLNCTESRRDCSKIWSDGSIEFDSVGKYIFDSIDINFGYAIMSWTWAINCLHAEELNLVNVGSFFS